MWIVKVFKRFNVKGEDKMDNFEFCNPTKILFGRGQVDNLAREIMPYSDRILLVYGGGSVKKSGLYDKVAAELKQNNIYFEEVSGIKSNPRITSVREGIRLCREKKLNLVLAVGGGSAIDASKAIAAGVFYDGDPWDFFIGKAAPCKALPIGVILTAAATGSEMNCTSVVSNEEKKEKRMIIHNSLYPKFSILDPESTFTVPDSQTAYGSADIMVHVFEQYFNHCQDAMIQDLFCEGILKTVIYNLPIALQNPNDYSARANLMWASTMALNGLIGLGVPQDWATHRIGQGIAAIYDIPHGASLAVVWPKWAKYVMSEGITKFKRFAVNVWGIDAEGKDDEQVAIAGIDKTYDFFKSAGIEMDYGAYGVDEGCIDKVSEMSVEFGPVGSYKKLYKEDIVNILKQCF